MSDGLKGILKKIEENTSKANSPTSSNIEAGNNHLRPEMVGDPNCPHCGGLGYVRADLPLGHADFGKLQICICRKDEVHKFGRRQLYAISRLDELKELTFENFEPRGRVNLPGSQAESLEQAYNAAKQFATEMKGWLLLEGGYGSGKTHLAAAIANFAVQVGLPTIFLTVPDLLDTLRFSYSSTEESFEERFEQVKQVPLLILDDFGTQNATEWAQEKLFQVLNHRYINKLPMVVTTNLPLEEIEARIRSRLTDPELTTRVKIISPDYRMPLHDGFDNELSNVRNLNEMTFATFETRTNEGMPKDHLDRLQAAFEAATKFAKKPRGWIVFYGSHGSGKTHLAASIANYRMNEGDVPLFVTTIDFLDYLRASFNPNSATTLDRRFLEVRGTRLLILDGLGLESATAWAREKLFQLIDYRYSAKLPTVITTADQIEKLPPFVSSRILDTRLSTVYSFTAPSYGRKKLRK